MHQTSFRSSLVRGVAIGAMLWSGAALAQSETGAQTQADPLVRPDDAAPAPSPVADAPTAADVATETPMGLEDIVVTAEKRSTSLQDVPIAVTALSASALSQARVDTTSQLQQVTPNLVVSGFYENVLKITLRGVGTNDFAQNLNPAVATYIDEVYMGLATGQALQFFDLDRVEVLRGPQGTLYGKNATGGALSYFSKRPSFDDVSGGVNALYGNYDRTEFDGFINVPLSDTVAVRASGSMKDRDGFFNNTFLGIKQRASESKSGRIQLLAEPTETFTAWFKVFASEFDGDVPHRQPIGVLNPNDPTSLLIGGVDILGFVGTSKPHTGETELDTFDDATDFGASAHLTWDLGGPTLTSITAYQRSKSARQDDPDGSRNGLINNSYFNTSHYVSQEIRLSGELGNLDYVIGGHFYRERHDVQLDLKFFECTLLTPPCPFVPVTLPGYPRSPIIGGGPAAGLPIATRTQLEYDQVNRSLAAFADLKYKLSDNLTLTGGLRYTTERRSFRGSSLSTLLANPAFLSPLFPSYSGFTGRKTWDNVSGRAVIDYTIGDTMLYASYSRGFRAGNWNGLGLTLSTVSQPVDPEILTSYEVGLKSEMFDRRVRLNLAAYYYDYQDLQVSIFLNTTPVIRNAAEARIYGGEAELTILLMEGLTLRANGGYTNAKYRNFNDGQGNDLSGNTLVNAPEWTATGGFTYETPMSDTVTFNASTDVRYVTRSYFNPYNFPDLSQGPYALVNARIGFDFSDTYSVAVWGRNLFDKAYNTDGNSQRAPFGQDSIVFGEPRMYGISASAKF